MHNDTIRPAIASDCAAMADIYNYYVRETTVTFEEESIDAEVMKARLAEVVDLSLPWLVAIRDGTLLGYAYASRWKGRCAYRFTAEATIYLDRNSLRQGLGQSLYAALLTQLRTLGMHAVIGGIALPNAGSIALHEKLGLTKVAHFPEVGFKLNRWIDVAYWQLRL